MPHRFTFFLCGLVWGTVGAGSLMADDSSWTLQGRWPSPSGAYVAAMEFRSGTARLTVKPVKDDKTIVPLLEQFDMAPSDVLSPPAQGVWSPKEDKFCVYYATGEVYGSGKCWLAGKLVELTTNKPEFPGDKPRPQFEVTKTFAPDLPLENLVDRIGDLYPRYTSLMDQVYGFTKGRWVSSTQIQMEATFSLQVQEEGSQNVIHYRADWPVTYQIGTDGFKTVESGPIRLVEINWATKTETAVKLPETSAVDELRVAARQENMDQIKKLLAQGANPYPDSAGQSPLLLAVMKKNAAMIDAMLATGTRPQDDVVCAALEQYDPAIMDKIFAASPKLTDDEVYWEYSILFSQPPPGVKTPEQWQAIFDHMTDQYLKLGANLKALDPKTGNDLLMLGINQHAPIGFLEKLIKAGADPSLKNKAGETAADMAAKHFQVPALRLLDHDHHYADFLKQYEIPANSPFLGPWTEGGYIATITLNPDATGTFVSMFGGNVTWKQVGQTADIQIHVMAQSPTEEKILTATGRLSADGKALLIKFTGDTAKTMGADEQQYEKGAGDPH